MTRNRAPQCCRCRSPKCRASRASRRRRHRRRRRSRRSIPSSKPARRSSEAMAEGRLLTPAEQSAKHFVGVLNRIERRPRARQAARVRRCRSSSCRAPRNRSRRSTPRPPASGSTKRKRCSAPTDEGVRKARSALTEQLIAMESAKPVPASALKISDLRRARLSAARQRAQARRLGRRRVHRRHRRQDAQRRRDRRVARDLVPPRSDGGRQQVAVRAARVHGPRDRADAPTRAFASSSRTRAPSRSRSAAPTLARGATPRDST